MTDRLPPAPHPLSSVDLDRLRPVLHRYCARMVGSALDGEDIVQEALLRALEAAPPAAPVENPEGWLFRIAHHLALDFLRRRKRRGDLHAHEEDDDVDAIPDPVDERARRDAAAASLPAFMHLPASQRSAVILFDILDYTAEEVGALLDWSVPAVKSALQRGRGRLRALAATPGPAVAQPPLSAAQDRLLRAYVDLFNARDFDALRAMLAADVRLDLVNRVRLEGAAVGEYYARYAQAPGWRATPGRVEGRPAVLVRREAPDDAPPDYVVVLSWTGGRVATIRDFLYARYVMDDAAVAPL